MINVSREPQNRSLLYVNEDLRIALILLRAQKSHYAMVSYWFLDYILIQSVLTVNVD